MSTSAAPILVTNANDAGAGSLRAAIELATVDPSITFIRFAAGLGTIELQTPLVYGGAQALRIDGRGATLDGSAAGGDLLTAVGGADLTLESLTLADAPGIGLFVQVPAATEGVVTVALRDVTVRDNGLHGLRIDDQTGSSPAGIEFLVEGSAVTGNGLGGASDFDGARIDEGGDGDLRTVVHGSRFEGNGGDGLELDERGPGSAIADVRQTAFDDNGPQDPADLEDGFDIDEADEGGIQASVSHTTASGNHDQGIDLDEAGPGDVTLLLTQVTTVANLEEGVKITEDVEAESDPATPGTGGGIWVRAANLRSTDSVNDDGVQLEEFGAGDVTARIVHSTLTGNDGDPIDALQDGDGTGILRLQQVDLGGDDVDVEGVEVFQIP